MNFNITEPGFGPVLNCTNMYIVWYFSILCIFFFQVHKDASYSLIHVFIHSKIKLSIPSYWVGLWDTCLQNNSHVYEHIININLCLNNKKKTYYSHKNTFINNDKCNIFELSLFSQENISLSKKNPDLR